MTPQNLKNEKLLALYGYLINQVSTERAFRFTWIILFIRYQNMFRTMENAQIGHFWPTYVIHIAEVYHTPWNKWKYSRFHIFIKIIDHENLNNWRWSFKSIDHKSRYPKAFRYFGYIKIFQMKRALVVSKNTQGLITAQPS